MTQQEKQLLIKDLCSRLPYGVKVKFYSMEYPYGSEPVILTPHLLYNRWENIHDVKPYLHTMSSMTEEEENEYIDFLAMWDAVDWLNAHHFDYRGLIKMGLALEAPADMYKTE